MVHEYWQRLTNLLTPVGIPMASLFVAGTLLMVGSLELRASTCEADIFVDVFNAYGGRYNGSRVSLFSVTGKRLESVIATKVTFPDTPCGYYILEVAAMLGTSATSLKVLHLTGAEHRIRVGLPIRFGDLSGDYGSFSLQGQVVGNAEDRADVWVRLEGVFLQTQLDLIPDRKGTFRTSRLEGGVYQILVFRGATCIARKSLTIELDGPSEISVSIKISNQ